MLKHSKIHTQQIYRAVVDGKVVDRQELLEWLESNQVNVTRQPHKFISIENSDEDAKTPIDLMG